MPPVTAGILTKMQHSSGAGPCTLVGQDANAHFLYLSFYFVPPVIGLKLFAVLHVMSRDGGINVPAQLGLHTPQTESLVTCFQFLFHNDQS